MKDSGRLPGRGEPDPAGGDVEAVGRLLQAVRRKPTGVGGERSVQSIGVGLHDRPVVGDIAKANGITFEAVDDPAPIGRLVLSSAPRAQMRVPSLPTSRETLMTEELLKSQPSR